MSRPAHIPRLLTVTEAAEAVGAVSTHTLRREIADGRLRARRVRGAIRIVDEDLAAWARGEAPPKGPTPEELGIRRPPGIDP